MDKGLSFLFICLSTLMIFLPFQANSVKGDLEEEQQVQTTDRKLQEIELVKTTAEASQKDGTDIPQESELETASNGQKERPEIDQIKDNAKKELPPNKAEIFDFLKTSFSAQVSLSEKFRSLNEIEAILDPFFSEEYKEMFIKANVVEEKGQYIVYGSDVAPYYIPFYSYSEKTKVVHLNSCVYVIEFFPASTEGPVGYEGHYEGIEMQLKNGEWKINDIWYNDLPEAVLKKASETSDAFPLVPTF